MNLNSKQFDCIVVGGGPAGSTFADIAAQNGLSVIVLEKDREIGVPVRCGEAVSDKGLRIFHDVEQEWINATITRIRLVAPNETVIEFDLKESGYILDRKIFDSALAKKAAENGAIIKKVEKIIKTAPYLECVGDLWFDKSDSMSDYFHTAYYLSIHVGKWDKPYEVV